MSIMIRNVVQATAQRRLVHHMHAKIRHLRANGAAPERLLMMVHSTSVKSERQCHVGVLNQ